MSEFDLHILAQPDRQVIDPGGESLAVLKVEARNDAPSNAGTKNLQ